jgi:hypothetical protein
MNEVIKHRNSDKWINVLQKWMEENNNDDTEYVLWKDNNTFIFMRRNIIENK